MDVIVIGASGGLGYGFLDNFARNPDVTRIIATYRSPIGKEKIVALSKIFESVEIIPCYLDALKSTYSEFEECILQFDARYVVNAIGMLHSAELQPEKKLESIDRNHLDLVFATNVTSHALILKSLVPMIKRKNPLTIASISAKVGSIEGNRLGGWYSYRMSKAALNMLIKTVSIETARLNPFATLAVLHPGTVDTNLSRPFHKGLPTGQVLTVEYSVECMIQLLFKLDPTQSGSFFAFDGEKLPW